MGESSKRCLVTGVTGQTAWYLAEHLLNEGHEVFGMVRGQRVVDLGMPGLQIVHGDLSDVASLHVLMRDIMPDEVYNLAAFSHVPMSSEIAAVCFDVTGLGPVRLYEAVRQACPSARVFQASSCEIFGNQKGVLSEESPLRPVNHYAVAKALAHMMASVYRESYGMHISTAISFNHESPRRGQEFVSRKIVRGVIHYKETGEPLSLGNLSPKRDWGWAPEYAALYPEILRLKEPQDIVVATGQSHSIYELLLEACGIIGVNPDGCYTVDESLYRLSEIDDFIADTQKARDLLGWSAMVTFKEIVKWMVEAEIEQCQQYQSPTLSYAKR